jgi:hypothetical protein
VYVPVRSTIANQPVTHKQTIVPGGEPGFRDAAYYSVPSATSLLLAHGRVTAAGGCGGGDWYCVGREGDWCGCSDGGCRSGVSGGDGVRRFAAPGRGGAGGVNHPARTAAFSSANPPCLTSRSAAGSFGSCPAWRTISESGAIATARHALAIVDATQSARRPGRATGRSSTAGSRTAANWCRDCPSPGGGKRPRPALNSVRVEDSRGGQHT